MRKLAIIFILVLTSVRVAASLDDNSDLVIPGAQTDIDQDAIGVGKQKDTDVSLDEAQKRGVAVDHRDHYQVVPYYEDPTKKPKLKKKLKDGTNVYSTAPSPQKYSGGFKVGSMAPTNLVGNSGFSYKDVYGNNGAFMLSFDLEKQFFQKAGKLGLKAGLGLFTAKGNGRFQNSPTIQALETISLIGVPLNAGLQYHLQFLDHQILVPYAELGADYFVLFESRGDQKSIGGLKYGGAAAWHWAVGGQLQLDFLDKQGMWKLDRDYGINHIYLVADARQINGLSSTFDFTSLIYEGGFLFEF